LAAKINGFTVTKKSILSASSTMSNDHEW